MNKARRVLSPLSNVMVRTASSHFWFAPANANLGALFGADKASNAVWEINPMEASRQVPGGVFLGGFQSGFHGFIRCENKPHE
ncbi:hypothetical protein [Pseudomonas migulae]|uniref:hypothetical protein n=1 Tax=Pseudomonas migulae TaxID=78543 RepID=UPI001114D986|nr:hypothetical protein [Pseudomonas migulae]